MAETHTGGCYCGAVEIELRIGVLRSFPFKPNVHLNYAETILRMRDGLPKLKDFPTEIGGSGETLPE
jgi:hypothetical protein